MNKAKRIEKDIFINTGKIGMVKVDGFVKSPNTVMPDLIRHPELIEITGFRLGRHPGPRSGTE
ncbi:MAG: hypothetical protein U9N83_10200 [Thermodesulfobacteriota bacterium]|nr:hypothetical protein [Thermodesulfobacteriota bacterium]